MNTNSNMRLQYNYAIINTTTGRCGGCVTSSYLVDLPSYVEVPYATNDYIGKYYNINGDHLWYLDAEFTTIWEECPSHNV